MREGMEMDGKMSGGVYGTKVCPRCGSELYADMDVCYGCLFDFDRQANLALPAPDAAERGRVDAGDTEDLSAVARVCLGAETRVGVLVRTVSVDVWRALDEEGAVVGRDGSCEVALHSPAVSRRHIRLLPTPDGMEVSDLGATNPATYRGREITGCVIVPYGDAIDVCGCRLVMTGPPSPVPER